NTTQLDMTAVVQKLETLTTLVGNADGTFTYTDEHGDPHDIDIADLETLTTIEGNIINDDGNIIYRITYTDENEDETTIDITATNGLNIDATTGEVKLGGDLTEKTEIETDNTNTLAITGLEYSTASDDKIVVADATTGVLKALKAAMPKFFYMPSIIIPTAADQLANPAQFGTIDLYAIYQDQFGSPEESSPGAPPLPVLPKTELFYYITWFDDAVFENVAVDANGVLTYDVKADADVTMGSFMNIVFAVKP